ncbi:MAG: hypothetical protein QXZ70_09315 [Candidatus Bathyarchaeia archaeon]
MQKKNLVKTAVVAGLVFIVAYALAAELIVDTVGYVGSGTKTIVDKYAVKVKSLVEPVNNGDKFILTGVEIKVNATLPAGTDIFVNVLGSSGVLTKGQKTLTSDVPKNTPIKIDLSHAAVDVKDVTGYSVAIAEGITNFP